MHKKDFKKMSIKSLQEFIALKKGELLKSRLNLSKNQNEGNVKNVKRIRKEIAQFLTIIKEKENHAK
jgi:ribosomal protein L29